MIEGPTIRRGRSGQDIETPPELMEAIADRFGKPDLDLAANEQNAKARFWFGPNGFREDSLAERWPTAVAEISVDGKTNYVIQWPLLWLNPPFDLIEPWVAKCAEEYQRGARILLLCRASIDSNWWWEYIQPNAVVYALTPRIRFVGQTQGYPSPLVLCTFNVLGTPGGPIQRWRWR